MPRLSEKFVFRKPRRTLRHLSVADQSRKRHLRRIYKAVRRHSRKNDFFGKRTPGSPAAKNTTSRGRMSPYTALFRIAGRTMTTMEAGIIGGDDFLRLCEKSSNQRFSGGASKASLSQRLPASLRMRIASGGKSAPFCDGFSEARNAARRSDGGAGAFLFHSFVPLLAFCKVVYKRKNASFIKGVTKF